jgi:hypothetical protein
MRSIFNYLYSLVLLFVLAILYIVEVMPLPVGDGNDQ